MTPAKRLAGVYLVFGEEEFLVADTVGGIISKLRLEAGSDVAVETLDCEETELGEIIEDLATPSLFSLNRITVLKHFKLTADSKLGPEIERCLASGLAPGQYLILAAEKVDKRLKLAKLLQEEGNSIEVTALGEADLRTWITDRFAREGKAASSGVAELLLDLKGEDLRALDSEITKLVTYVGEGPKITLDHLHALVGRSRTDRIFDLVRHVLDEKRGKALDTVADLLDSGESGIGIISYISREIRWLIQADLFIRATPGLWDARMKFNEFTREVLPRFRAWVEEVGISPADTFLHQKPYAAYRRFLEAKRRPVAVLVRMLEGLVEANRLLVHASMTDRERVALESFVSTPRT